jgi:hypothetical protein
MEVKESRRAGTAFNLVIHIRVIYNHEYNQTLLVSFRNKGGDAMHVMSPFACEAVRFILMDAYAHRRKGTTGNRSIAVDERVEVEGHMARESESARNITLGMASSNPA